MDYLLDFIKQWWHLIVLSLTVLSVIIYRVWDHWIRIQTGVFWAGGEINTPEELILCVDVTNRGKTPVTVRCLFLKKTGASALVGVAGNDSEKYLRQNEHKTFKTGWNKDESVTKHNVRIELVGRLEINFWKISGKNNRTKWVVGRKEKEYKLSWCQIKSLNNELIRIRRCKHSSGS